MRRIAFVAHLSELSGAGVALLEIALALQQRGHRVYLVLPGAGPLANRAASRGIEPTIIANQEVALSELPLTQKLALSLSRLRFVKNLRRFFVHQRIDMAYINTSANVYPGLAARLAGIPVAWHIHETLTAGDKRVAWKARVIRQLAHGLIYASRSGVKSMPPPPKTPHFVARNFVPVDELRVLRQVRLARTSTSTESQPRIFTNGTIARKGTDVLLEALQVLARQRPEISPIVTIAGAKPAEPAFAARLNELTTSAQLTGRVQFAGLLETLAPELAKADLFISPSRNEALPIAIVEAMAVGVPVIATNVGDCSDLLGHGRCGWLVPPEDPAALAAAIEEALSDSSLAQQKADAAFEKVIRLYGAQEFWEPLDQFVNSIMSGR